MEVRRVRGRERIGEHLESLGRQRGEQAAAVGEVVGGRGVRDAGRTGQFA